jgi:hypothetical protein
MMVLEKEIMWGRGRKGMSCGCYEVIRPNMCSGVVQSLRGRILF